VYFADILRRRVHRFDPATNGSRVYDVDRMVGAVALSEAGDLIMAVQGGFARLDPDTGRVSTLVDVDGTGGSLRMNDGKVDPAGRFWAGTMALDERAGAGALYRLDPDGSVHTMLRGVTISNGLDWSDDGRTMFYIDSPTYSVDAFDFDPAAGTILNRRPFATVPKSDGAPDGLTIDAEGHVWVAFWGGGAVRRYAPDGTCVAEIRLPPKYVTSCTFGGADRRDLYITTQGLDVPAADRAVQQAGALFVARPGPRGRPANRFKG
jgi:sugar lactone lactonase YvrE